MVRISRARLNMEDGRVDRAILKDYGESLIGGAEGINTGSTYLIDIDGAKTGTALSFNGDGLAKSS